MLVLVPKSVAARLLVVLWGLLFLALFAAIVAFEVSVKNFVPSRVLEPTARFTGALFAFGAVAVVAQSTLLEIAVYWKEKRWRACIGTAAAFSLSPFFFFALVYVSFSGPISYVLHRAHGPERAIVLAEVVRADDLGSRGCRNRLVLEGSAMFWLQQICSVSEDALRRFRRERKISLDGEVSPYGVLVLRFGPSAVLPANMPVERIAYGARSPSR